MKTLKTNFVCLGILVLAAFGRAQEDRVDRLVVPFSDSGQNGIVSVGMVNGGITVTGYDGQDVIVEARVRGEFELEERSSGKTAGMLRIPVTGTGLTVEEDDNKIRVSVSSHNRTIDVTLKVPFQTSLHLRCVNDGDLYVENVEGDIEVNNINGDVSLLDVAGSVVAFAHNGELKVTLQNVYPDKAMSFGTFNDDVDVTLPAGVKADVKIKSEQGSVYSDFVIDRVERSREIMEKSSRDTDGKYKVRIDNTFYGKINGGGPEFHFKSYNGDILIRKGK